MKFETRRTMPDRGARQAERTLDLERSTVADEGVGVLRPTDALSRRPGSGLGVLAPAAARLRVRSRTYVQPMGSTVDRSRARRG